MNPKIRNRQKKLAKKAIRLFRPKTLATVRRSIVKAAAKKSLPLFVVYSQKHSLETLHYNEVIRAESPRHAAQIAYGHIAERCAQSGRKEPVMVAVHSIHPPFDGKPGVCEQSVAAQRFHRRRNLFFRFYPIRFNVKIRGEVKTFKARTVSEEVETMREIRRRDKGAEQIERWEISSPL